MSQYSYKDFGIPDEFAVEPGNLIKWWPKDKTGSISNRCQLYNQFVIYDKLLEIEKKLGIASRNQHPANHPSYSINADISATVILDTGGQQVSVTTADAAVQTIPAAQFKVYESLGTDYTANANGVQECLDAAAVAADTNGLPPLIRRFVSPKAGNGESSSGDQVEPSVSASAAKVSEPQVGISEVNIELSTAPVNQTTYSSLQQVETKSNASSEATTMAPSDAVTQDLAGLVFATTPQAIEQSSPAAPAQEADEEQLISLQTDVTRLWDRVQALGDNYAGSNSSATTIELPPSYHARSTISSDRGIPRLPAPQTAQSVTSSAPFHGSITTQSISIRAPPSTLSAAVTLPRIYQHTSASTTSPRRANPASSNPNEPAWVTINVETFLARQQQQARASGTDTQLIDPSTEKGKGKEREGAAPTTQAGPSTAPAAPASINTRGTFSTYSTPQQQRSEANKLKWAVGFW
ncbi:MAG: hypothetical protein Q9225_000384 [Loekoesia sp. 1 TL-2023]